MSVPSARGIICPCLLLAGTGLRDFCGRLSCRFPPSRSRGTVPPCRAVGRRLPCSLRPRHSPYSEDVARRRPCARRLCHYLFESQGQVIDNRINAADALWADYGTFRAPALPSLDLGESPALTRPLFSGATARHCRPAEEHPVDALRRRLTNAAGEVNALVGAARFAGAEALALATNATAVFMAALNAPCDRSRTALSGCLLFSHSTDNAILRLPPIILCFAARPRYPDAKATQVPLFIK